MNDTWGYKRDDRNFKSPKEIIELLCCLVSKGANLLLNIGPKANGEIPEESIHILNELGDWMEINSEAIYETDASPFMADFSFGYSCQKENCLYVFVKNGFTEVTLRGLKNRVIDVQVLGGRKLEFTKNEILSFELKEYDINKYITVVKIVLDGKPKADNRLYMQEKQYMIIPAYCAKIKKANETKKTLLTADSDAAIDAEKYNLLTEDEINITKSGIVEGWFSENDYIEWDISVPKGEYEVIVYSMTSKYKPWMGGHRVSVVSGENHISADLKEDIIPDGANRKYFSETGSIIGKLSIKDKLILRCEKINREDSAGLMISKIVFKGLRNDR